MTTYTLFTPSPSTPFQFQPTLDGNVYTATVTWGLSDQHWYLNLRDLSGNLIITRILTGSPDGIPTMSLSWSVAAGRVTVKTLNPHGIPLGGAANLTISGVTPYPYNGTWLMLATGQSSLQYEQSTDPGSDAYIQGTVVNNFDLVAGYFNISTLVFRTSSQMFEVTP